MVVEQNYTSCLAQGAYYIESDGEAAVIDPLREYAPYIERAQKDKAAIKYIFETHFHADFVSGHVDLAEKTGARIVFGPHAETGYNSHVAADGEEFKIGRLTIKVLHTPGHTLESTTYLLLDEQREPHCIFTGDTLFIGDVGRPDLAIKSDLTQEDLAGMLYDSLRNKIIPLPDHVIVYPAHGAGSACGKNMSKETSDTLGNQKATNYALGNLSKQEFIKELTSGILPPPQYFEKNAALNKTGYLNYDDVISKGNNALDIATVDSLINSSKAVILDVRKPQEFAQEHIPNALYIGIDGQFAPWVGALIKDINQPIILLTTKGREQETIMRLSRVGYDNCLGYINGGIAAWKAAGKPVDSIPSVSPSEFAMELGSKDVNVLDVRKPGEYDTQHLSVADNKPLDFINDWVNSFDKSKKYYVHCAGGYRSMIAASILRANGYQNLVDINGGFSAIKQSGIADSEFAGTPH